MKNIGIIIPMRNDQIPNPILMTNIDDSSSIPNDARIVWYESNKGIIIDSKGNQYYSGALGVRIKVNQTGN